MCRYRQKAIAVGRHMTMPFLMQDTLLLPNSFIFMYVGTASRVQWHPFTLAYVRNSTGPDIPAKATLHIKPYGRWGQV